MAGVLEPRRTCYYDSFGRYRCYGSTGWYNLGRWILLGIVLFVFVFFLLCICLITRRRRRRGVRPYYGTGWMARGVDPAPPYQQNAPPQPEYVGGAPPTYGGGAPPYGGGYGAGPQQESGVAKPAPAHGGPQSGGYEMYAPPPGPPPNQYH